MHDKESFAFVRSLAISLHAIELSHPSSLGDVPNFKAGLDDAEENFPTFQFPSLEPRELAQLRRHPLLRDLEHVGLDGQPQERQQHVRHLQERHLTRSRSSSSAAIRPKKHFNHGERHLEIKTGQFGLYPIGAFAQIGRISSTFSTQH